MTSREGMRPLFGSNQVRKYRRLFVEALKRQFREMVKVMTAPHAAQEPPKPAAFRRRRKRLSVSL